MGSDLIVRHLSGIHPLDIPADALTTVTWWDVMDWVADVLRVWDYANQTHSNK